MSDMAPEKKHDDATETTAKPNREMSHSEVMAKLELQQAAPLLLKAAQVAGRELTPAERDAVLAKQEAAGREQAERLKRDATGTNDACFQEHLITQVVETIGGLDNLKSLPRAKGTMSVMAMLKGIQPQGELEGMLAAQMVATHSQGMECLRRAALGNQTFEGRELNLKHAAKLMATFCRQLECLDKHRGKGQQTVTVEHVHVQAGGQAIVGNVETGGPVMRGAKAALSHAPIIPFDAAHVEEREVQLVKAGQRS